MADINGRPAYIWRAIVEEEWMEEKRNKEEERERKGKENNLNLKNKIHNCACIEQLPNLLLFFFLLLS